MVSSGCAKLLVVESGSTDLFIVTISFGFARFLYENAWPSLLMFLVVQILFSCTNNLPVCIFFHAQICIAVGNCFVNSLANGCCTALFNCDRAYSNTQNTISLSVNDISLFMKIKTLCIKY